MTVMKRLILTALVAGALVACSEDIGYVGTERMLIASKTSIMKPIYEFSGGIFYYVKMGNSNDRNWQKNEVWRPFSADDLKNFEHKDGYESLVEIYVYKNFTDDEPIADAPMYSYGLKQVISREKKNSEGLPPLELNIEY
jgi:hypothetical protein